MKSEIKFNISQMQISLGDKIPNEKEIFEKKQRMKIFQK